MDPNANKLNYKEIMATFKTLVISIQALKKENNLSLEEIVGIKNFNFLIQNIIKD
jgi:hypothetical protein